MHESRATTLPIFVVVEQECCSTYRRVLVRANRRTYELSKEPKNLHLATSQSPLLLPKGGGGGGGVVERLIPTLQELETGARDGSGLEECAASMQHASNGLR